MSLGGYYTEKQCAYGTQFDPARAECKFEFASLSHFS